MKIALRIFIFVLSCCTFLYLVPACSTGKLFTSPSGMWRSDGVKPGMTDKDISRFMSQLRPHQGNAEAHYQLGCWYHERGRDQEATKEFQKAIYIKPGYVEAYNGLGVSYDQQGDYVAASDAYRMALKLNANLAYVHSNLGHSYILQGRNAEAIDELKQAIALGSTNKQTYNNLGLAYMLSGQPDLAMKEFEATGNQALAHSLAAKLYYRKGEFEKAKEHYTEALALDPDSAPLQESVETTGLLARFEAVLAQLKQMVEVVVPGRPTSQEIAGDALASVAGVGMEVSNGNGVNDMARKMGRYLKEKGFNVVRVSNADHFRYQRTTLLYKAEYEKATRDLAGQLPEMPDLKEVKKLDRPSIGMKVVLGKDLIAHREVFAEEKKQ